jgi:hypothetical protein
MVRFAVCVTRRCTVVKPVSEQAVCMVWFAVCATRICTVVKPVSERSPEPE